MTATNRFLNRLVLAILGLICLAAAGLVLVPIVAPLLAWDGLRTFAAALPTVPAIDDPTRLWILIGAAVLVVAVSIAWVATRGRGRTRTALDTGTVVVDDAAIAGILRHELADTAEVLAVHAHGFRIAGGVVLVDVETRSRVDLPDVLSRVRAAVDVTDRTIGTAVPMVVHLTTGLRTATTGSRVTR